MSNDSKKWLSEYESFLNSERAPVPQDISQRTLSTIERSMRPPVWTVFLKLLGIHLAVGSLSLSVCHQFGMNPFSTEMSLDRWVMAMWGHSTCMVICGVLFTGLSFLCAGYFLSLEEVQALKRTEWVQISALAGVSLTVFALCGAELALTFAGLWLFGALLGGFIATETVWKLRVQSLS